MELVQTDSTNISCCSLIQSLKSLQFHGNGVFRREFIPNAVYHTGHNCYRLREKECYRDVSITLPSKLFMDGSNYRVTQLER